MYGIYGSTFTINIPPSLLASIYHTYMDPSWIRHGVPTSGEDELGQLLDDDDGDDGHDHNYRKAARDSPPSPWSPWLYSTHEKWSKTKGSLPP